MSRFDADRSGVVPSRVPTFEEFVAEKIRTGQFNPVMPDPSGGGGGVTANDINGQLGPVVVGAPLAPAPQIAPPAFSSQPLPTPGSPMFQLGGSSDQLLTVPSGGYSQLPINPNIVNEVPDTGPQVRLAARKSLIPDVLSRLASGGLQTVTGAGLPAQPPALDYGIPDRTTGSLMQQLFPTGFDFSAPDPSAPDKAQLTFDPEAMYRAYLDQGMDPQTARDRVNAAVEAQLGPAQQTLDVGRDPNAHDDGTAGLLTKAGQLVDKTRQFSQGNESDALYNYITETEMTVDQAIAAGKAAPGTTPEMWQQYLDLTYGQGGVYGSDLMSVNVDPNNPGQLEYFSMYDRLDPAEKAQFKREFLDAYENGYSPTKKVLTDIGTWVDVPTGEFFKPGSEAGHEYIASTKSWWERAGADVAQDPASFLGVEKAPLEALASYGTRLAEREGATTAVKVVGNSINMFARAGKLPNAILNEAPDALIQAPIKSIAEAAAPYTDLFNTHIRGTAIKEGNSFIDAQHEATRAQQTAGGYEPPVPPEPVTIDPITGAPSTATLTTPPDLPGAGPSSASPSPGDRLNPFGTATPSKPSSVIPANPNQADIDDLNRQIQIRESMIEDGSLTGDDVASAQREIEDMKREVATLQGPTPDPVIPGNPQQGPLFIPERDALGNLVIPESDLPVWEPDPNKRPAWQEGLGPATGTVGPDAAEPLPIPFERITNELTQRRLELQQIDVRLGEFDNGKSPSFPEGFGPAQNPVGPNVTPEQLALQEQRDQVEQIVSDLEDVVAEIEQKATAPEEIAQTAAEVVAKPVRIANPRSVEEEFTINGVKPRTWRSGTDGDMVEANLGPDGSLWILGEDLRVRDYETGRVVPDREVKSSGTDFPDQTIEKVRSWVPSRLKADEAKQVSAKPIAPVEAARAPEQAAVQPAVESAAPTDDGYVKWIADVKDGSINPFDPRVPRPDRLIDKVAQSDKWESFDALNAPKRSEAWDTDLYIQDEIDRLKEEARALPYEQGREMWATAIHPRIIDQQIASLYHIVNDVVPDLKNPTVGFDIGDIPITAERKAFTRTAKDVESLSDPSGITPGGNKIGADEAPVRTIPEGMKPSDVSDWKSIPPARLKEAKRLDRTIKDIWRSQFDESITVRKLFDEEEFVGFGGDPAEWEGPGYYAVANDYEWAAKDAGDLATLIDDMVDDQFREDPVNFHRQLIQPRREYTIIGGSNQSGTPQRRYIRQDLDGSFSVRKTQKAKTPIAEFLTEAEAIALADKDLAPFPRKVAYQDDNLNYLIQRAVLRNEEKISDALRMRIGTSSVSPDPVSGKDGEWFLRITPDQYDAIQQLRRELQINLGNTVVSANDVAEQWSVIKRRLLEQSSANLNDEENGILYRIASDANTYDEALKRLSGRTGDTLFGPSTKNLRKKIADDIKKAMAEGLANGDGQVVMFNSGPNPNLDRASIEEDMQKKFLGIATRQRGAPERAMIKIQEYSRGGVYDFVVEHVGDLTHRMTDMFGSYGRRGDDFGFSNVKNKVEKSLDTLNSRYGFEKELLENVRNNGKDLDQIKRLGQEYADQHRKIPVYNRAQLAARDAAVALGEFRFSDARANLRDLQSHLGSLEEWQQYAGVIDPSVSVSNDIVEFNSGPNPFGTRDRDPGAGKRAALDAAGKMFQAAPIGTASDQAEEIVNRRFRGGQYSGLRYQDVYEKVNLPKAKRDKQIAMQLVERGADADRLTREEIKDIRLKKKSKIVEIKAKSPAAGQMTIGGMQPNLRQRLTHSRRIEVNLPYGDLNDDQLLAVLQMEYGRYGDILTDTPEELATHRTATDIAESIDPTMKNQRRLAVDFLHMIVYRMPRTLLLADPLTAWTYTMRNVMSNWMMTTMDNPSWVFSGDGWKAVKGAYSDATIDKSIAAEMNAVLTGGHIPQELRSTVDKMSEILSREKTPVARALDDLWGPTPILSKLGDAFDWKRGIDRGIERGMKIGTGYVPFLRMNVDSSILTLSKEMEQYAMSRGMSIDQAGLFDRLWGLKDANGVFSRHDVYDSLYYQAVDLGYTEEMARKYAETASRRWQNLGKQAELDAVARIERVYPSNLNQTKLDHYLNYIAFFHFWPSRAAKFLLEEMIRHPQYALWWYRAHQGVARMAEEGEYPDAVKGLIKVSSGPLGLALYANPAAFFMVTSLLPAGPDLPDRQGTTWLGEHLTNIKQRTGTGPVPFIDAALNLIGIYGDSYMPDVFPSRTADLALATLDAALVASGHPPHSPVWDQTMENARETFSAMMPWANGGVPAGDASGYIQDVVGSMILQQNPDLWRRMSATEQYMDASGVMQTRPTADAAAAMEEYNAILDDEKDPRYTAAEKAVVYGNLFVKGLNLISPLSMRGKPIFRGESIQLANQGRDKKAEGLQPTPAESAQIGVRSIVTDSPASRDLKAERAKVQSFGTARQVTLADGYNQIAYDPITPGTVMVIGNDIYTWEDVMTMSQDDRKALADKWLIANHGLEDYKSYSEGKKALTDSLPSVSAYNDWAGNFRNDDGTINAAYRDRYMELSPGYKAYIDQLPAEVKANPADFDQKSVSQDAFLAASGESTSVYNKPFGDASDISAFRPDEIMGGGSSGGSSGGSKSSTDYETATSRLEKLNKSIAKYDKEMAEFDKKVMEITGGVPFDGLAPEWQASLARRLEREGIKTPSKPATVKNYEEWKALQEKSGLPSDKMTYIEWTIDQASALADEAAA